MIAPTMGSGAAEPSALERPPRISSLAGAVIVGLLFAALCLWLFWVLTAVSGLIGWTGTTYPSPGPADWPFVHAGLWSLAANVAVGLAITFFCALCVRDRLQYKFNERVALPQTFAILVLAGYIPYLAAGRLTGPHFLLGLIAIAFLLREYALGVAFRPRLRHGKLVVAAALIAALLIPAAYGATHPLRFSNYRGVTGTNAGTDWTGHQLVLSPKRDTTIQYSFTLSNTGFTQVRLLSITGGDTPMIRVARVVAGVRYPWSPPSKAIRDTTVGVRREQAVTLFIRAMGCNGATGTMRLSRITVRYRTGGLTLAQPVALAIRPTLSCP